MKKYIAFTFLFLWLVIIFLFSCESAKDSTKTSKSFTKQVIVVVEKITKIDLDEMGKDYISNGGHLWINVKNEKKFFISCGPIFMLERNQGNTETEDVLSTYLFGGCAFYHRETFLATKGFDEKFFIGYEDVDYSLELFRRGYKIANCCYACLVHNHPHDDEASSYDRERYRYDIVKKGAEYFREKNGYEVWDEVTERFFIEQSLKKKMRDGGKKSISEIYQSAKENYRETSLKSVNEEDEETGEDVQGLRLYSLALEQTVKEYKIMDEELRCSNEELRRSNEELRIYNMNQENGLNELRTMDEELRAMNNELRHYSQEQEKANAELNARVSDLQNQLDTLQNLSEKERKLIRFLRRRRK